MKSIFKLFPVALAAFALASCSNEDFFGGDNATEKAKMNLTVESMDDSDGGIMRTAYDKDNKRTWQATDKFTVYDDELHKYDFYKYNPSTNYFELDGQKDLNDVPKMFVAFPSDAVITTYWDKATRSTSVDMGIKAEWDFEEINDGGTVSYLSQLPMWGTAVPEGEGVNANVHFLTSYIKITIDNALNNVKAVRIRAYKNIAGTEPAIITGISNAVLSENDTPKSETTLTTPTKGNTEFALGNTITVNLENESGDKFVKSGTSCIFIPIIAGHYGKVIAEYLPAGGAWGSDEKAIKT